MVLGNHPNKWKAAPSCSSACCFSFVVDFARERENVAAPYQVQLWRIFGDFVRSCFLALLVAFWLCELWQAEGEAKSLI